MIVDFRRSCLKIKYEKQFFLPSKDWQQASALKWIFKEYLKKSFVELSKFQFLFKHCNL